MAKKRLLAWILTAVMAFGTFGSESLTAFAISADKIDAQSIEVVTADSFEEWAAGVTDGAAVAAKKAIWMDTSKTVDARVEAILSVMTLEEKAAQMVQPEQNGDATPAKVKELGIGSVLSGGGSAPASGNTAQDWADRVNEFKAAALESRLGIPLIYGVDAVHGHNNVDDTVIFPHNIGFGSADNVALAKAAGEIAAEEIRATGIQWTFAPTLGVVYNERWGRYYEGFSEDADLAARMGAAFVEGFQGTDEQGDIMGDTSVAATAKHYIGEGQTEGGVNQGNVNMSEEAFEELLSEDGANIIKPYEDAIAAGAKTVMASYNSVDGVKCHGNKRLLTDILKGERTAENPLGLNFQGFVVSDYNGLDQIEYGTYSKYFISGSNDAYTARVAASIDAGVDMFMEPYDWANFINATVENVEAGVISPERIDDAVARILRVKFEMGLFEEVVASDVEKELLANIGSEEHRAVAKQAVEESLVVLKNDEVGETGKTAFELLEEADSILVAGYKANDVGAQCGGWTISWQGGLDSNNGSGGSKVTEGTTIYEGFVEHAGEGQTVSYNARGKISGQDVAVVVVGEEPYAESNGDRAEDAIVLPDTDLNVIKTAIDSKGDTPVVLILMTGRPVAIADLVDDVDAVVQAWLPGTEGDGVASVMLDSAKDFKGTLPVTWTWYPQDIESKFTDSSKVLFPFGTGMKKDGTSIKAGGQTEIPNERPEGPTAPETPDVKMYKGGIDIDAYGGKVEAEYCQPSGVTFDSYNVSIKNETVGDEVITYVDYDKKEWGNAKWKVYFRQAGTYKVSARIQMTEPGSFVCGIGQDLSADNLGGTEKFPTVDASDGYIDYEIGEYVIANTGLYGIKLMDIVNGSWATSQLKAKLDYLTIECISPTGDKDNGTEEEVEDPADETPKTSQATVIVDDAVEVYMTSTEKAQDMSWYKYPTEMANQMSQKASIDLTGLDKQNLTTISVNPDKEYQEILGFGTSLEESTINNLIQLAPEVQDEFLRKLVDPEQAGMTLFRVTIGTSDFTSKKFYTYYDAKELTEENAIKDGETLKPDWYNETGNGFSIQKDIDYKIIDTIKKVQALAEEYGVEDEIRFFASSWTPPGWMKEETSASKSYKDNDLLIKGGSLVDEYIDDVAMYYTRYLEEYAKQGIDIYAITLQNEPMLEIDYPSCAMTGVQEGKLAVAIKEAVAASDVLSDAQKQVKLWAFDHNPGDAYSYTQQILSVEGANEALDGVAFHDYGGALSNMQKVLDELLNQNGRTGQTVNLTERSVWGTTGANSIITYLRNSAISYNSWVTMLDSNVGVHQWVGTPDPTMFARAAGSDNDYWAMPEYYMTGQFSRFIRPGYVRVDSNLGSTDTITNVVFKNPETGELVAVVVNATDKKQNFKFVCEGTQFIGAVPAKNIATYVWNLPDNIHYNVDEGFAAVEYANASEGVTVATDENQVKYISTTTAADYIDYIVDIEEAGTYGIIFEQQPSADDQKIGVYQGDVLLREVVATKTWNSAIVNVRVPVTFESAGTQQLRIKMSEGVKLYSIKLVKMDAVHAVPGKIPADEYDIIVDDGGNIKGASVNDAHQIDNTVAWSTIKYKINVPADGTYKLTVSSAVDAGEPRGYYAIIDQDGDGNDKGVLNVNWGQEGTYVPSGDWGTYTLSSIDLDLTAGEHTIGIKIASSTNIEWIALGSYVDVQADEITEGAEDGTEVVLSVVGGTIGNVEDVVLTGLPEGVTATPVKDSDSKLTLTLAGNRSVDFDEDVTVTVDVPVAQGDADGEALNNQISFVIKADKDEETLVKPEAVNPVELEGEVDVLVKIDGGTFTEDAASEINITGNALLNYKVLSVIPVDSKTLKITLAYTNKIYKASELEIEVPVSAYDDSKGNVALTTSVMFNAEDALPDAIEVSKSASTVLTEDIAYAYSGSLADGAESGTYVDYFIDVKEAGNYTIVYSIKTSTSDGTSYTNAWDLNRGVPGSVGTNSYKQMSIPGLWTGDQVKMGQMVELSAGQQTLEIKAKTGGYSILSVEIVPCNAKEISTTEATTIAATAFNDAQNNAVIIGENVEYTVAGTALDYVIKTEKSGKYSIVANYGIESSSKVSFEYATVEDGVATTVGSTAVEATGAWGTYKDSPAVEITLPKGEFTLHLTLVGDGANVKKLTITPVKLDDDTPEPTPVENPFGDVKETDWYYKYAKFAYDNKLMTGKGNTDDGKVKFDPANNMTRAEFVQMLYSKEGKPSVEFQATFMDVKENDWFACAVIWANQNGIVKGTGETFNVSGNITRQEMAAILYKYAVYKGYDVSGAADITGFVDDETVANWAVPGMQWAVQYGVVSGKEADGGIALAPNGTAIRAEAATMVRSFMVAYEGVEK